MFSLLFSSTVFSLYLKLARKGQLFLAILNMFINFFSPNHYVQQHFRFLILNHCSQAPLENCNPKGKVPITGQSYSTLIY